MPFLAPFLKIFESSSRVRFTNKSYNFIKCINKSELLKVIFNVGGRLRTPFLELIETD